MFAATWHGVAISVSFAVPFVLGVAAATRVLATLSKNAHCAGVPCGVTLAGKAKEFIYSTIRPGSFLRQKLAIVHQLRMPGQPQQPKLCQSPIVPTQLVGLTPEEVAFAEEVLGDEASLSRAEKPHEEMPLHSNLAASHALRELHLAIEADDTEALHLAIADAERSGVPEEEIAFGVAVLQLRMDREQKEAMKFLQRVMATTGGADAVRLRSAILLARAAGISREELQVAENLLAASEQDLRRILPSALASHRRSSPDFEFSRGSNDRRKLSFAAEDEVVCPILS
eukprot:TRINITY_DN38391_c0_g1_i1.p1 TRINITY_DN38391_c0_g1~~TRINITY_DN38391_c0_g1_i1.p1  ORF type:complete len:285 (-),score=63.05 TRINITY_DN38391_c0_g1_i1:114-968(-)